MPLLHSKNLYIHVSSILCQNKNLLMPDGRQIYKKNDFHLIAAHENTKLYHFLINFKDIMIYCYLIKL